MSVRICELCKRSINFGVSRVIWGEGLAHASCRDAKRQQITPAKETKPKTTLKG